MHNIFMETVSMDTFNYDNESMNDFQKPVN